MNSLASLFRYVQKFLLLATLFNVNLSQAGGLDTLPIPFLLHQTSLSMSAFPLECSESTTQGMDKLTVPTHEQQSPNSCLSYENSLLAFKKFMAWLEYFFYDGKYREYKNSITIHESARTKELEVLKIKAKRDMFKKRKIQEAEEYTEETSKKAKNNLSETSDTPEDGHQTTTEGETNAYLFSRIKQKEIEDFNREIVERLGLGSSISTLKDVTTEQNIDWNDIEGDEAAVGFPSDILWSTFSWINHALKENSESIQDEKKLEDVLDGYYCNLSTLIRNMYTQLILAESIDSNFYWSKVYLSSFYFIMIEHKISINFLDWYKSKKPINSKLLENFLDRKIKGDTQSTFSEGRHAPFETVIQYLKERPHHDTNSDRILLNAINPIAAEIASSRLGEQKKIPWFEFKVQKQFNKQNNFPWRKFTPEDQ